VVAAGGGVEGRCEPFPIAGHEVIVVNDRPE
jgi:hypothetical protein